MADMIPLTVGAALAYKQRGQDRVAVTSFGDAATSRGDFHEGLNIAAVLEVPAIFVAENNGWGYSTPITKQTKVTELYKKAAGYGVPGGGGRRQRRVRGVQRDDAAVEAARAGPGPQFIECRTYRMGGHAAHDKYEAYMPMETLAEWSDKDPLKRLEGNLTADRGIDGEQLDDDPRAGSRRRWPRPSPRPTPTRLPIRARCSRACSRRTGTGRWPSSPTSRRSTPPSTTRWSSTTGCSAWARTSASRAARSAPPRDLQQRFGVARSIDTPVAEAGIAGVAIGAAMAGQRPVAEMQFGDFVSIAFDQLVTCAAKMHYRIGWAVPMVMRCPNGGGVGGGPVPLRERRGLVPSPRRPQDRLPGDRRGRLRAVALGDPRPQPGRLLRAQVPLPAREGRGADGRPRRAGAAGQGRGAAQGHRHHDHRLRLDGALGDDRGRAARRRRAPRPR